MCDEVLLALTEKTNTYLKGNVIATEKLPNHSMIAEIIEIQANKGMRTCANPKEVGDSSDLYG